MTRFSVRTSPPPPHLGQTSEGIVPRPRQAGHGRLTAKPPCPKEIVPRPLHSSQVVTLAPGAAPLPPQVEQASVTGKVTGTLPPIIATRNGTSTCASRFSARGLLAPAARARRSTRRCPPARPGHRTRRTRHPRPDRLPRCPAAPPRRRRPAALEGPQAAHLVVVLALVRIREHGVRLGDLLEALGRAGIVGIGVGMVLLGEPAVRLLDLGLGGRVGNAQDLVEVPLRHYACPWSV